MPVTAVSHACAISMRPPLLATPPIKQANPHTPIRAAMVLMIPIPTRETPCGDPNTERPYLSSPIVQYQRLLFVLFCTVGGPVSYFAGVRLSDVEFGLPASLSLIMIAVTWLLVGTGLHYLHRNWSLKWLSAS